MARASVEPISWSALPCWWSAERWLAHVVAVYRRGYLLTRPQLVTATGGGVSLRAVLAVATAHARAGDYRTGRCSRPLLGVTGGTTGITATTKLGQRTVTRARTWLRLVGLATEVAPARHRSFIERLASWERGDTRRGWTAEYALHLSARFPDPVPTPVDNPGRVIAGQTVRGTPPRSGSSSPERSDGMVVTSTTNESTTPAARDENGAPRRAMTPGHARDDFDGWEGSRTSATALMLAWRASEHCPRWARQYGAHRWSGVLSAVAAAGWTARDLNQLLTDLTTTGHQVLTAPRRPISYLCHLLGLVDINERPTAIPDAHAAAELAARTARTTAQLDARDTHTAARHTAVTALTGPGRAAALTAAHTTATAAAHRRSERESAERLALAEQVQHRRNQR
ncbi:hypothetical protein RHODO2019_18000 (plasmid) [Rhodococcus antarcticus]|uniref:Replication protein n=1 Tax=Rhodococcus antarcticus TaxID=2987751 RepID=A0ABY6P5E9_9NOCA|nr:hypothetical protein [Rhodococcus antarcticus]UZJ26887.1 hypothetical protein RHODO2019_18000 [Rhodococcus antarcticus]